MDPVPLKIQMLGEFSIRRGGQEINDSDNRSRKVWLLLAYMIYCRNRAITPEELVGLLWGAEERSSNPLNALKTMFHRVRASLNQLDDRTGHELIVRKNGSYAWNTAVPLTLDIDGFDRLCQDGHNAQDEDERLACWLQALELYKGDFLAKLAAEPWVVPIADYYHNLYVQIVLEVLPILERRGRWQDTADLCRRAVLQEPYSEALYAHLITALLRMNKQQDAVLIYEDMSELLLSTFGVMPSDPLRALYREALRSVNDRAVSSGLILDQLREPDSPGGALLCDYDFFRAIYQSVARLVGRSGSSVHLALISVSGENGSVLSKRSLDRVMSNLQELIRLQLRRGDIAARCSVSQFILLLPQANYENSCMVCTRITKAFTRQYPHSPAVLHISVQPLEPNS